MRHRPGQLVFRRSQGRSFRRLLRGEQVDDWPDAAYYRYWEHDDPIHHGARPLRHTYGRPQTHPLLRRRPRCSGASDRLFESEWELYDLRTDPEELVNVAGNPSYTEIRASLTARLAALQNHYADIPYEGRATPRPTWSWADQNFSKPSPPTRKPSAQTPDVLPPGSRGCGTFGPVGEWVMVVRSSTSLFGVDRKCRSVAVCSIQDAESCRCRDILKRRVAVVDAVVETYYRDGSWHTRRGTAREPFASGPRRERLITVGVEVARWNGVPHIIRDADGAIVEVNDYITAPR